MAVSLFEIHKGVQTSKLVEAEGRGRRSYWFNQFASIADDDTFKPGEYSDVSFYEDVNYRDRGTCHYKFRYSFIASNPIKF